jgi:hypothetical protein
MENKLRELRDNYHKGLVSVIVGAGFSKNACEEYPSWEELLYDMVVELYQDEIEKAFIRYQSLHSGTKTSLDEFTSEEVYRVIKKIGYLKVVTDNSIRDDGYYYQLCELWSLRKHDRKYKSQLKKKNVKRFYLKEKDAIIDDILKTLKSVKDYVDAIDTEDFANQQAHGFVTIAENIKNLELTRV